MIQQRSLLWASQSGADGRRSPTATPPRGLTQQLPFGLPCRHDHHQCADDLEEPHIVHR